MDPRLCYQIAKCRIRSTGQVPLPVLNSIFASGVNRYLSCSWPRYCDDRKYPNPNRENLKDGARDGVPESQFRKKYDNPISRTFGVMRDDLYEYYHRKKALYNYVAGKYNDTHSEEKPQEVKTPEDTTHDNPYIKRKWPHTCDVLVIGGGAVGSSIAYHLKERALGGLSVVVVEQDSSYRKASTALSVGGIRQQFSLPENIELSLYGAQFLRHAPQLLAVEGADIPDMQFNPHGYLTLASEEGVEVLKENFETQLGVGAKVEFLTATKLKKRFPWISTEGIAAGVIGLENEGWFDPWSLLSCLKRKAISLGAEYVDGKVTSLGYKVIEDVVTEGIGNVSIKNMNTAEVSLPNGETRTINYAIVVVAAGAWSGDIGRLVGIGEGEGLMGVPIPVEPRKRYVYCIHAPDGPGLDCPLVIDPNGTYFRREGLGGLYLCGRSPAEENEPLVDDLEVNEEWFYTQVWPTIAKRAPAFENLKLQSSWAGFYDYNTFDQNGIIGLHPLFANMFIATGFSGHGIQQAPGVGRAIMECILRGEFSTINLERLGFERFLMKEPIYERNIMQCVT
ncbi:FAD-dependent oxidoreductase domain-containing protein 1 [Halocaridina rubra]|uniref:FAD-dependent oxidoreductase domain-containing protein 1 n=1 Tax=Halocaridina rubra TaxID=373956 RepID=A0AAN8ZZ03_HALRR